MQKIQIWSRRFRLLFQLIFIFMVISFIAFWINPQFVSTWPNPGVAPNYLPTGYEVDDWNAITRFIAAIVTLIPVGLNLAMIYCLIILFKRYEKGEYFSTYNVGLIRKMGSLMLLKVILSITVYKALISLALTWHKPAGYRMIEMSLSGEDLGNLIVAGLIILISWIMLEASKLKHEHDYTV
jgi:hypothetical protein